MRSIGDHGDRSLIFSPKIRIENGSQSASVSFCIQRKIANYLEESKELLTFAAETFQIIAIMTAIQLRAELFREMNPMLENEAMLSKMLAFVKKLFAEQQAEMKVTDKKSYQVIEVDPEIKKWSGCTSFSAHHSAHGQR